MRDSRTILLARLGSITNVCLILKRLKRPIKELRRNDYRAATYPTRSNLDGLALSSRNVVALLITELGEGYRSHI